MILIAFQAPAPDVKAALEKASSAERAGDLPGAARIVEQLLAATPDDVDLLVRAGLLRARAEYAAKAAEHLERATKLAPKHREAWLALGEARFRAQEFAAATAAFTTAESLGDADGRGANGIGSALLSSGKMKEAAAAFERAAASNPRLIGAKNALGRIALDGADNPQAVRWFKACLELDPNDADSWSRIGIAYKRLGDAGAAMDAFRHAIAADPLELAARQNLGRLLISLGREAEGTAELEAHGRVVRGRQRLTLALESLKLEPNSARSRVAVGDALLDLSVPAEALHYYREAMRIKGAPASAFLGAARASAALGDAAGRDRFAEAALAAAKDDPSVLDAVSEILKLPASRPVK